MLGIVQGEVHQTGKSQIINDDTQFEVQQQEKFKKPQVKAFGKEYNAISIVGPQGTGKSTILNELFGTKFQVRKAGFQRTTRGVWYDVDLSTKTLLFDVEGSDSNQAGDNAKSIERKNSLFALTISHKLLVNIKIGQVGLFKGSLMQILQIILQLNLKLFGSEQAKEIIYVIRDYEQDDNIEQNVQKQTIKNQLFSSIQQCWDKIVKPIQKQHIRLSDIFKLKAFFIHNIKQKQEREKAKKDVIQLKSYLLNIQENRKLYANNVFISDFPKYIEKIWKIIQSDQDINIPHQKVLISNMRCNEIKKQAQQEYKKSFINEVEKSEKEINEQFVVNLKKILSNMLQYYEQKTDGYLTQEIQKVKKQFINEFEQRIQVSFSLQRQLISAKFLKELKEQINKIMSKKQSGSITNLRKNLIEKFKKLLQKVCYNQIWMQKSLQIFQEDLNNCLKDQKERILNQSLLQFNKLVKKQIQNMVNKVFSDKIIFCNSFWETISKQINQIEMKAKNSIVNLFNKLQLKDNGQVDAFNNRIIKEHWQKIKDNSNKQLRSLIKARSHDLQNYIMVYFRIDFHKNQKSIPYQWNTMKPQEIKRHYNQCKDRYEKLIDNFKEYTIGTDAISMKNSKRHLAMRSSIQQFSNDYVDNELLSFEEQQNLRKIISGKMDTEHKQALKDNENVYSGSIPKWAWIIFIIVILDDCKNLFLQSWLFLIIVLVIALVFGLLFAFAGKSNALAILNTIKQSIIGSFINLTGKVAIKKMKPE